MQKISQSLEDFEKISKDFLEELFKQVCARQDLAQIKGATLVGLFGDLGAGKTTFVQYLGKHLGIKEKINSPTFVLMKRYLCPKTSLGQYKFKNIYHIDAYRLEGKDIKKELEILGWSEMISKSENLVLVEWPEILEGFIPKKYFKIYISHTEDGKRKLVFKK